MDEATVALLESSRLLMGRVRPWIVASATIVAESRATVQAAQILLANVQAPEPIALAEGSE